MIMEKMGDYMEYREVIREYAQEVGALYRTGATTEHSFRGALARMMEGVMEQYRVVNEPRRTECGAPDYALIGKKDGQTYGYVEAKDLFDNDLRGVSPKGHKEQFDRYKRALGRVCFTDYLEFRFCEEGEETEAVTLLRLNKKGGFDIVEGERFASVLREWAMGEMQPIRTAKRLAEVMAHKARLLAEALRNTLSGEEEEGENGGEGSNIRGEYEAFRKVLLHDLTKDGFADLYAQTIVYGLFAARLNDEAEAGFDRRRAAELIPVSNMFLRKIFQEVAGYDLDERIAWIVDDLAKAFAASDVRGIMGKYEQDGMHNDPLIHFYEDFLAEYDPRLRHVCGVYYTPRAVVRFIVRAVDEILARDFGLRDGLADATKVRRRVLDKANNKREIEREFNRVQILDPAAGTGAFLAEAAERIKRRFAGNEGV